MSISTRKKILLHLPASGKYKGEKDPSFASASFELSQEGISDVLDISQNRVSKLLTDFESEGLVEIGKKRFKSCPQKRKVYFLSEKGEKKAKRLKKEIKEKTIFIETENGTSQIKIKDLDEYVKGNDKILFALRNLDEDGRLDLTDMVKDDFFVDRDKERKILKEEMKKVRKKGCSLLLFTGPAGIGKTHLVEHMKEYAKSEGFVFLRGNCERKATNPLHPFVKALSDMEGKGSMEGKRAMILDPFEQDIEYEQKDKEKSFPKKEEFFNWILGGLKNIAEEKPHIMFLDALQLVDRVNFQLLKFLAENLEETPILFIGTMKKEEVEDKKCLDMLDRCSSLEDCSVYGLKPFDWRNTRKMVNRKLGRRSVPDRFVDLCQKVSKGLPLFLEAYIEEMLKEDILDPIGYSFPKSEEEIKGPSQIREIIRSKLDRLSDKERDIIEISAVMGDDILLEVLTSTAEGTKEEVFDRIDELKRKNLLKGYTKDALTFFHPLIKTMVVENIGDGDRKRIHQRIAENIDKDSTVDIEDNCLALARHYEIAEKSEKAMRFYIKAGKKAESVYANQKARELYRIALDLCDDSSVIRSERLKVMEGLAQVEKNLGDLEKSSEYLQEAVDIAEDKSELRRLYRKLGENLREVGDFEKAREHVENALSIIPRETPKSEVKREKCKALKEMGMIYLRKHDYERCEEIFNDIKDTCEEIDYRKGKGEALHYLGTIDVYRSNFEKAEERLKKALMIRKEIDDIDGLSRSYNNLGVIYRNMQEHDKALNHFQNSNRIRKDMGFEQGDPEALDNMGIIYYDKGDLKKALKHHQRALDIEERIGDKNGIAATLDNIGVVLFEKGELDEAIDHHERSLKLKKELGNKNGIALSHFNLGKCYKEMGKLEKALKSFNRSLEINEKLDCEQDRAYSLIWRSLIYMENGMTESAEKDLDRASKIFVQLQDRYGKGMSLSYLGKLMLREDCLERAEKYLNHGRTIGRNFEDGRYEVTNKRFLAEYHLEKSELKKAFDNVEDSISLSKDIGALNQEGKCMRVLGNILCENGDHAEGEKKFEEALNIFEKVGNQISRGKVLFDWGNTLLDNGEESKGTEKIETARDIFNKCGADGWCKKIDNLIDD